MGKPTKEEIWSRDTSPGDDAQYDRKVSDTTEADDVSFHLGGLDTEEREIEVDGFWRAQADSEAMQQAEDLAPQDAVEDSRSTLLMVNARLFSIIASAASATIALPLLVLEKMVPGASGAFESDKASDFEVTMGNENLAFGETCAFGL